MVFGWLQIIPFFTWFSTVNNPKIGDFPSQTLKFFPPFPSRWGSPAKLAFSSPRFSAFSAWLRLFSRMNLEDFLDCDPEKPMGKWAKMTSLPVCPSNFSGHVSKKCPDLKSRNRHVGLAVRKYGYVGLLLSSFREYHAIKYIYIYMGWDENIVYNHFRINNWHNIDLSTNKLEYLQKNSYK